MRRTKRRPALTKDELLNKTVGIINQFKGFTAWSQDTFVVVATAMDLRIADRVDHEHANTACNCHDDIGIVPLLSRIDSSRVYVKPDAKRELKKALSSRAGH